MPGLLLAVIPVAVIPVGIPILKVLWLHFRINIYTNTLLLESKLFSGRKVRSTHRL